MDSGVPPHVPAGPVSAEAADEHAPGVLAAVVEGSPAAVVVLDDRRRIVYCNPAAVEIFGMPSGVLHGRDLLERIAVRDHGVVIAALGSRAGTPTPASVVRADGERRSVELVAYFGEAAGHRHRMVSLRDVTTSSAAARSAAAILRLAPVLAAAAGPAEALDAAAAAAVDGTSAVAALAVRHEGGVVTQVGAFGLPARAGSVVIAVAAGGARIPGFELPAAQRSFVLPDAPSALATDPALAPLVAVLDELGDWHVAASVPLVHRGAVVGVLVAYYAAAPSASELDHLAVVAPLAAIASAPAVVATGDLELATALTRLAESASRGGVPVEPPARVEVPKLPAATVMALYRLAQEAVGNALEHARPSSVWLTLSREDDAVVLQIGDDGCGLDTATADEHYGLRTIRDRAQRLGASLQIDGAVGRGTLVSVRLPLTAAVPTPRPHQDDASPVREVAGSSA